MCLQPARRDFHLSPRSSTIPLLTSRTLTLPICCSQPMQHRRPDRIRSYEYDLLRRDQAACHDSVSLADSWHKTEAMESIRARMHGAFPRFLQYDIGLIESDRMISSSRRRERRWRSFRCEKLHQIMRPALNVLQYCEQIIIMRHIVRMIDSLPRAM